MNRSASASCGLLVELPQRLAARLLQAAQTEGITLNRFLHVALTEYLDRLNAGVEYAAQAQNAAAACADADPATALEEAAERRDMPGTGDEMAS